MAYSELKRPILGAPTPETMIPRETGWFENVVSVGFDAGIKQTTGSFIEDIATNDRAKSQYELSGESEIPEAVYNDPRFALRVEGIDWEPHLNQQLLDRARESRAVSERFAQTEGFAKYLGFLGGAIADPLNIIPVPFVGPGASIAKSAVATGLTNAVLEFAITPLMKDSYEVRGEELTGDDVLRNMGFALLIGGGLGGGIAGLGKLADRARAMGVPDPTSARVLKELRQNANDFNLDDRLVRLLDSNVLRRPQRQLEDFSKLDLNTTPTAYVDNFGFVTREKPEGSSFLITRQQDGTIAVVGDIENIVKARKRIADKFPEQEIILNTTNGETARFASPKEFLDNMDARKKDAIAGNKDDFDTLYLINDLDSQNLEIRINPENNKIDFIRKERNPDGTYTKGQILKKEEVDELLSRLNNLTPNEIAARAKDNTRVTPVEDSAEINRLDREAKLDGNEARTKNIKDEVIADLETRTEQLDKNISLFYKIYRSKIPQSVKDSMIYDTILKGTPQAQLSRLGYNYDVTTRRLTRIQPAKDLTPSEVIAREDFIKAEKRITDHINDETGRLDAINCATKKGL